MQEIVTPETLAPLTPLWWKAGGASIALIAGIVLLGSRLEKKGRENLALALGVLLLVPEPLVQLWLASRGLWNINESLPLHLCDLTAIFSWMALIWRNQKIYECLFYWGIPGALVSLATPEFTLTTGVVNPDGTLGSETLIFLNYYIGHGGILAAACYLTFIVGMRPGPGSWWKISLMGQPLLLTIGLFNWTFGTNYIFLCEPPHVANPLIIGGWPWYVIGMITMVVAVSFLLYLPFRPNHPRQKSPFRDKGL